jgi:hypothetical protein
MARQLDQALARLGSPRAAAEEFSGRRALAPAPIVRRLLACAVDYLPLLAVSRTELGQASSLTQLDEIDRAILPRSAECSALGRGACRP